jgi:hypothetical protein
VGGSDNRRHRAEIREWCGFQEVTLADQDWFERMTLRDLVALCPLLATHINRYGHFDLDMEPRLPLIT